MTDAEKDAVYARASALLREETEQSLAEAMRLFASVRGWKDADRQLARCRTAQNRLLWKAESARLKAEEDRHEVRVKRRRRVILVAVIAALLVLAMVLTVQLRQLQRYNHAAELYTAGEYRSAAEAFMEMDGYHDARGRAFLSAVALYHAGHYEEAVPYFRWLDGDFDNGYYLRKCYERLGIPAA